MLIWSATLGVMPRYPKPPPPPPSAVVPRVSRCKAKAMPSAPPPPTVLIGERGLEGADKHLVFIPGATGGVAHAGSEFDDPGVDRRQRAPVQGPTHTVGRHGRRGLNGESLNDALGVTLAVKDRG